jgi:hypothetical protein
MIYLSNDSINEVALILGDYSDLYVELGYVDSGYVLGEGVFVIEFFSEYVKNTTVCHYFDRSPVPSVYNLFNIEIGATYSPTQSEVDGPVNLLPGQYTYKVLNNERILDIGMMIVERKNI